MKLRPIVLAGTLLIATTSVALGGKAIAGASTNQLTLATVSQATLIANGVSLTTPVGQASVSSENAAQTALASMSPAATVREETLANLTDSTVPGIDNELAWVVSLAPPGGIHSVGGPAGSERLNGSFMLVFVDAETGKFLYADAGGEVQPSDASRTQK